MCPGRVANSKTVFPHHRARRSSTGWRQKTTVCVGARGGNAPSESPRGPQAGDSMPRCSSHCAPEAASRIHTWLSLSLSLTRLALLSFGQRGIRRRQIFHARGRAAPPSARAPPACPRTCAQHHDGRSLLLSPARPRRSSASKGAPPPGRAPVAHRHAARNGARHAKAVGLVQLA